jgi:AbrB family looped-hinge helix DNA binding protein
MPIIKTSSKGQLVIPGDMRKSLGIKPGQKVFLQLVDRTKVEIYPIPENPVEAFCGIFNDGSSLVDALIDEKRKEKEREGKMAARFIRTTDLPEKRKKLSKSE